mmetsp:Transcript_34148/g.94144  ORF Transcript_34148/g.94144 Transcript_34148/m.94144 type:complete len:276 (+) Transcript_34148:97-924(+)
MAEDVRNSLVICAPTFFHSCSEPRFEASLATLAAARKRGYRFVLVDGSPGDGVADVLSKAGATVVREEARGKANALRQALRVAGERFPSAEVFAFQELEKADFVRFYECIVPGLLRRLDGERGRWDMCNPARSESSWLTYPTEQVLEERFQNQLMHLNARRYGFPASLDWSFGPFLFRREHLEAWLTYPGQSYDSQWGPMVQAFKADASTNIGVAVVDYVHSPFMKAEEEGQWEHAKRRLKQLQDCIATNEDVWANAHVRERSRSPKKPQSPFAA